MYLDSSSYHPTSSPKWTKCQPSGAFLGMLLNVARYIYSSEKDQVTFTQEDKIQLPLQVVGPWPYREGRGLGSGALSPGNSTSWSWSVNTGKMVVCFGQCKTHTLCWDLSKVTPPVAKKPSSCWDKGIWPQFSWQCSCWLNSSSLDQERNKGRNLLFIQVPDDWESGLLHLKIAQCLTSLAIVQFFFKTL